MKVRATLEVIEAAYVINLLSSNPGYWSLTLSDDRAICATNVELIPEQQPATDYELDQWMRERGSC